MAKLLRPFLICCAAFLWCVNDAAGQTTLTFKNGETQLSGELIDATDDHYLLRTDVGTMTVAADKVICQNCDLDPVVETIRISGQSDLIDQIGVDLWTSFARRKGLGVVWAESQKAITLELMRGDDVVAKVVFRRLTNFNVYGALIAESADMALTLRPPNDQEIAQARGAGAGDLATGRRSHVLGFIDGTNLYDEEQGLISVFSALNTTDQLPSSTSFAATIQDQCDDPIRQSLFAANSGDNPFAVPIILHVPQREQTVLVGQFLEFTASIEAKNLIRRQGWIHRLVAKSDFETLGNRLADATNQIGQGVDLDALQTVIQRLKGKTRLSVTLRFQKNRGRFDAVTRDALAELTAFIESGKLGDQKLIIAAFGDGQGRARRDANRAATEIEKMVDINPSSIVVEAFGNTIETICDDGPLGEYLNRRVEFWID